MVREVKQASFRLNAEDTEKFKAFCEESEMTAAQGFSVLLEVMELDRAGRSLPARQTEIENFEQLTKGLVSAFLHSLELNESAENRVREQFSMQLESQTRTILDYQEQISTLQSQLEESLDFAEAYRADLQVAQDNVAEAEKLRLQAEKDLAALKNDKENQLSDKENIIAMLTDKLLEAERKAEGYDGLEAQNTSLKASLASAEQQVKDIQKDAQNERERLLKDSEVALERAVRKAEKSAEAESRKEFERLRSQNTELLQTIAANERGANEQLRALDKENTGLKETIAGLRAQLSSAKK